MDIRLVRNIKGATCTIGDLSIDGNFECHTLEDQVREIAGVPVGRWKVQGETAIPVGTYRVTIDLSARFGKLMPHVLDVPGFSGIRIHKGNTDKDTEGCILLGKVEEGTERIAESTVAFDAFLPKLESAIQTDDPVTITIINGF